MRERRGRMEEQNKNTEKKENEVQTSQTPTALAWAQAYFAADGKI